LGAQGKIPRLLPFSTIDVQRLVPRSPNLSIDEWHGSSAGADDGLETRGRIGIASVTAPRGGTMSASA